MPCLVRAEVVKPGSGTFKTDAETIASLAVTPVAQRPATGEFQPIQNLSRSTHASENPARSQEAHSRR